MTNEAGIRLSKEDIVFLSRLFCDYVQNTEEGKRTVFKLLNTTVSKADPKNAYYPNPQPQGTNDIPASELQFYSGWVYKKTKGLSTHQIEVEANGGLALCDDTGIMGPKGYCVQSVKDYSGGREVLKDLSNYARMLSDNPDIRGSSNQKVCALCTHRKCEYHPNREPVQLMLAPPRSTNAS